MMTLANALQWRYGGVADTSAGAIVAWRHPTLPKPTKAEIEQLLQDFENYQLRSAVKAEANGRIEHLAPGWKQRNRLARSAEFLRKGESNLTGDEAAELAEIDAFWSWVKSVRAFSDSLEAQINAGAITTKEDIAAAAWPDGASPLRQKV